MHTIRCPLILVTMLSLSLTLAVACAWNQPKLRDRRVVVMNFENTTGGKNVQAFSVTLAEMMTGCLANYPRVVVMDRNTLETMMTDPAMENLGWRELGRRLKVDYVIAGSVSQLNDNYIINTRLLSVRTGEIVKGTSATRYCNREEDLYPVIQSLSRIEAHHIKTLAEMYDALALGRPYEPNGSKTKTQ